MRACMEGRQRAADPWLIASIHARQMARIVCFRPARVNLDCPCPTVILMKRTRGHGGNHADRTPFARGTPPGPMSGAVGALAPDAAAPRRALSPSTLGARRGAGLGLAALARGHTGTGAPDGPAKTDGAPARGAPQAPGLCGSAVGPLLAPAHCHDTARAVSCRWHPAVHPRPHGAAAACNGGAGLSGGARRLPLTPPSRLGVATHPGDGRKGSDGLAAVGWHGLGDHPLEGAVYVCRTRAATALNLLGYAGQGVWLLLKRWSQGRCTWWPPTTDARVPLSARERSMVLWHGNPAGAQMARAWRRVAEGAAPPPGPPTPRPAARAAPPGMPPRCPPPRGRGHSDGCARGPWRP